MEGNLFESPLQRIVRKEKNSSEVSLIWHTIQNLATQKHAYNEQIDKQIADLKSRAKYLLDENQAIAEIMDEDEAKWLIEKGL